MGGMYLKECHSKLKKCFWVVLQIFFPICLYFGCMTVNMFIVCLFVFFSVQLFAYLSNGSLLRTVCPSFHIYFLSKCKHFYHALQGQGPIFLFRRKMASVEPFLKPPAPPDMWRKRQGT